MKYYFKNNLRFFFTLIPCFISIFLFPFLSFAISPALIEISQTLKVNVGDLNILFLLSAIGGIFGQLSSTFYSDRFGRLKTIIGSYVIIFPIVLVLIFSDTIIIFKIIYFIAGYFLGVVWIQTNAFILESSASNKDRIITIALIFYPIGAIVAPLITILILNNNINWHKIYIIFLLLIFLTLIIFFINLIFEKNKIIYLSKKNKNFKAIFNNRRENLIFSFVLFIVLFYCFSETIIWTWLPTFLRIQSYLSINIASFSLSLFWIAIVIGRVFISIIINKINNNILLTILFIISILSMVFLFSKNSITIILLLSFLAGIGFSAIFPLLVSYGSSIYYQHKDILLSILLTSGAFGKVLASYLVKLMSKHSIVLSIYLSLLFMLISFFLFLAQFFLRKGYIKYRF